VMSSRPPKLGSPSDAWVKSVGVAVGGSTVPEGRGRQEVRLGARGTPLLLPMTRNVIAASRFHVPARDLPEIPRP
jgi:hypothetical protein